MALVTLTGFSVDLLLFKIKADSPVESSEMWSLGLIKTYSFESLLQCSLTVLYLLSLAYAFRPSGLQQTCQLLCYLTWRYFKGDLREMEVNQPAHLALVQKSWNPCQDSEKGMKVYKLGRTWKTILQSFAKRPHWCGSSEEMASVAGQERESWRMITLHSPLSLDELSIWVSVLLQDTTSWWQLRNQSTVCFFTSDDLACAH